MKKSFPPLSKLWPHYTNFVPHFVTKLNQIKIRVQISSTWP